MLFSYYPMNLELLYLIALYVENDIAPKFIHLSFALLTAVLVYHYVNRRIGRSYAYLGVILLLSVPVMAKLATRAYVDLGLVFFSTASMLSLFRWVETRFRLRHLVLSAVFCGLAMGTKYNGLVTACLLGLFVPFFFSKGAGQGRARSFKALGYGTVFLGLSLAVFSPWMIRNQVWTGNPVFPLYDGLFRGQAAAGESDRVGPRANTGGGIGLFAKRAVVYGETWWEVALLPLRIFFQGRDGDPRRFDGRLTPFLLVLPLFAFVRGKRDPPLERMEKGGLLAFAVLYVLMVLFTREMRVRYVAPIIPPLVILSVFGVNRLARRLEEIRTPRGRVAGWGLLGGGLLFLVAWNVPYLAGHFKTLEPLAYLTRGMSRDEYLTRHLGEYPALQYINAHVPRSSKTLFLFLGGRGYYCDRPYILDRGVGFYRIIKHSKRPEHMLSGLRKRGVTHLLIRYDLFDKWTKDAFLFTDRERAMVQRFLEHHAELLFFKRAFAVFRVQEDPSQSPIACLPQRST